MRHLIRFLAVIALALSPVWGVPEVHAASSPAPAHYPVWPSFLSTGCQAIQGSTGSTTISCGDGSFLLSQVNSGYACNQIDISVPVFNSGQFLATATVNSGSQSNSVSITDSGNYFMQFPGFLVNNLVTIQIQAISAGSMSIQGITSSPCPVATSTPTVNPSFTPTNTPVPSSTPAGATYTITPIPTFTPLPSGHSTFTPTRTATGTVIPATATPGPGTANDCGDTNFPVLDCNLVNSTATGPLLSPGDSVSEGVWTAGTLNTQPIGVGWATQCVVGIACSSWGTTHPNDVYVGGVSGHPAGVYQSVVAGATGTVHFTGSVPSLGNPTSTQVCINPPATVLPISATCVYAGPDGTGSFNHSILTVTAGTTYYVWFIASDPGQVVGIYSFYVATSSGTPLPTPTSLPTSTPPAGPSATPSNTPIPIPGAMSTAIPTSTECPGGCAVAAVTSIPGMATIVKVDTSPFDPLKNLSLTRSTCQPFGWAQIPIPVIHGTPALGSTTPLSYTWTAPITGSWANTDISGTLILTNTAVQPCAMSEIPTFVWDLTYWLSVLLCAVGWFMWLIGYVGRLSGEETING